MTLNEFVTKYLGKKVDWDKQYGGQCVDLYRQYINDVLLHSQPKGVVGAADFWTNYTSDPILKNNYERIANTPDGVPQPGDVVLWNKNAGGGYGHVAIFLTGTVNSFTSLDQNWPIKDVVTKTKHDYVNVLGWLRPKKGSDMQIDEATFNKLVANSTKWDGIHKYLELSGDPATTPLEQATNSIGGIKSRVTDLSNQLAKAEAEVKNREEQVGRLKEQIANEQSLNKALTTKLNDAMGVLKTMAGDYEGRIEVLQAQVNDLARDKGELNKQIALLQAGQQDCFDIFLSNIKKLFRR